MSSQITDIILVRHGQTQYNILSKIQGHIDSDLTDHGRAQARALAKRVALYKPNHIYSSDLSRAHETANILGQHLSLTPKVEARIRETSFGPQVEGKSWPEINKTLEKEAKAWHQHERLARFPGGESREEALERSLTALNVMVDKHPGETILAVTHGGILAGLFAYLLNIPPGIRPRCLILNTSINILRHDGNNWGIKTWGDVSHLEEFRLLEIQNGDCHIKGQAKSKVDVSAGLFSSNGWGYSVPRWWAL